MKKFLSCALLLVLLSISSAAIAQNQTISMLPNGGALLPTDMIPISRCTVAGCNYKIFGSQFGNQWTTSGSNLYFNTGTISIGTTTPAGTAGLTVVGPNYELGYFGSTGANASGVVSDDQAGGYVTGFSMWDAGVHLWAIRKLANNSFGLYDDLAAAYFLTYAHNGNLVLGGAQTFTIGSTGLLGVGTNNPQNAIHAYGTGVGGTALELQNGSTGGQGWDIISTGSSSGGGAGNLLFYYPAGPSTPMTITSGGSVGIGTTSPGSKLSVSSLPGSSPGTGGGYVCADSNGDFYVKSSCP